MLADLKIEASILVVVVLPLVPEMMMENFSWFLNLSKSLGSIFKAISPGAAVPP
ncbi:unnamed protein product, partial [marine sediment metagenome]